MNTIKSKPMIVLGAGGHASVLVEWLLASKQRLLGVVANNPPTSKIFSSVAYLGDDTMLMANFPPAAVTLINGIGGVSVQDNIKRDHLFTNYKNKGYTFETLVHPSAIVAPSVFLDEGSQIMAGVVLQSSVSIGKNTIINTRASIDHDCKIGDSVHVAPGAILCGHITIEKTAHVGVGATILQGITVGQQGMVRAGGTIVRNILSSLPIVVE